VYAGATVGAWYPITPATALMEAFKSFCEKYRVDKETGLHNYAILQAEDELAAAGITIGAGWMGARAFTNTSGPGISLMQEFIGLAYYTDIPRSSSTCSAAVRRPVCRHARSRPT
jgi:2-oxoglutarate ferredoxin oxidoreductase subunit alpha